ncbi:hypothetical protein C8J57DRAFT_1534333 [Mycena rebaudengoi]|nr:hypothetical protein C8J57DRAFT_1534333 [Mycena rebaudengoi]
MTDLNIYPAAAAAPTAAAAATSNVPSSSVPVNVASQTDASDNAGDIAMPASSNATNAGAQANNAMPASTAVAFQMLGQAAAAVTATTPPTTVGSSFVQSMGLWIAGSLFNVLPPIPLTAVADNSEKWYAITKGKYIGITPISAIATRAVSGVSNALQVVYHNQAEALATFNFALAHNLTNIRTQYPQSLRLHLMLSSLVEQFTLLDLDRPPSPVPSDSDSSEYYSADESPATPPRRSFPRLIPVLKSLPSASGRYFYQSPAKTGITDAWDEAAHAMVSIPGAHSHRLTPKSRKSQTKLGFAVFYGHQPGPYSSWMAHLFHLSIHHTNSRFREHAGPQVSGIPGAIHQGYISIEAARAAFDYASSRSWVGARSPSTSSPLSRHLPFKMPLPRSAPEGESSPLHHGTWYVVYKGIAPGMYKSSLECTLNTVGIQGSTFDSTDDKVAAFQHFYTAQETGRIAVLPLA